MSYLSQKCRYETGGRQHSLSFPQRRKKTKVTDPEEVTNLTGWVTLSLRLEWEQPSTWCSVFQWLAQQHLFKALGDSWKERETASSPSLHGRGVQASYQVCSQSEALIVPSQEVTAFLSFLSCLCLLCLKLVTLLLVLYAVQSMCRSSGHLLYSCHCPCPSTPLVFLPEHPDIFCNYGLAAVFSSLRVLFSLELGWWFFHSLYFSFLLLLSLL